MSPRALPASLAELEGPQAPSSVAGIGMAVWAALVVAGRVETLREGAELARESIDTGATRDRAKRLAAMTSAAKGEGSKT